MNDNGCTLRQHSGAGNTTIDHGTRLVSITDDANANSYESLHHSRIHNNDANSTNSFLPILALLSSQLIHSSWHVLGKHVMHQVPYLTPISYVLLRTGITASMLLIVGRWYEGHVQFPPLFPGVESLDTLDGGCNRNAHDGAGDDVMAASFLSSRNKKVEDLPPQSSSPSPSFHNHSHHRPRRKRRVSPSCRNYALSFAFSLGRTLSVGINALRYYIQHAVVAHRNNRNLNPEAIQIITAGLSGMLLLPLTYTTGLILTTPTVASVWDGPMIPLGCFCAAVGLGVEKRSESWPLGQVGSLILAVGGSLVVLLGDYAAGNDGSGGGSGHWEGRTKGEFVLGNMVLMGVVAAYSAMALLQKRLNHYPPMTLTGWMFGFGFLGCLCLVLFDSALVFFVGGSGEGRGVAGCTLRQALRQLYVALTTSPTFCYGLLYACFFVGGICFSIASYAASHLESSVITLFAACQPPMTAVLEWIWEGKGLGWKKLGGMMCVGVGMWCFTYIKRIEKERKGHGHGHRHDPFLDCRLQNESKQIDFGMGEVCSNKRSRNQNLTNRTISRADV